MKLILNDLSEIFEQLNWLRNRLLVQLQELQADLEELSDEELLECRDAILNRVNECLDVLEESNEDNQ